MARLTKQEAFKFGFKHGYEMASESGSSEPGSEGWDGLLINADPAFAREKLGWEGQGSDEQAVKLLDQYCRGCQKGAKYALS